MTPFPQLDARTARRLRGVFRLAIAGAGKHPPPLWFLPEADGTIAVIATADITLTCRVPNFAIDRPACVPWMRLAKSSGPVELDEATTNPPSVPPRPETWNEGDASLLAALAAAAEFTAKDGSRYALDRVQIRGRRGEIIATDSKQAMIWGGWSFPFADDLLVPRPEVFGTAEFFAAISVKIGRTATHLVIKAGDCTVFLSIDAKGRFPDVSSIVPRSTMTRTRWMLDAAEGEVLVRALPKFPGRGDDSSPVTLDLGKHVVLRARGEGDEHATVVPLPGSRVVGPPLCVAMDRRHLARACNLGCREIEFSTAEKPAVARHGGIALVWMLLPGGGLSASPHDILRNLGAIAGKPVRADRRPVSVQPAETPTVEEPVPVPTEADALAEPPRRPGLFDTLIAGSSWLLATIRLKSIGSTS